MADRAKDARLHDRLYKKIPSFTCIEGCTDCCGPVPWTSHELRRGGLEAIPDLPDDGRCPLSLQGRCDIHERRPFMCRLFGTVEDMRCPHGRGPLQLLSRAEGHDLVRRYKLLDPREAGETHDRRSVNRGIGSKR